MNPQEALNTLVTAAAEYRGTAREHSILAEAARTLNALINPPPKDAPAEDAITKAVAPFVPKGGPRAVRTRRGGAV